MKGLLALAVIAAFAPGLIGTWALSEVSDQAGAAPACPPEVSYANAGTTATTSRRNQFPSGRRDESERTARRDLD
jgi:hypothetical protein